MLKLQNISKYYSSNDVVALGLRKVSLEFKIGEFIAVTGESGSGKSTLLNVISGLDTYEDGEMYVAGEETSYFNIEEWENYRKQYIGFVFQNYNIIDSYTVLDNVMLALTIQGYDKETRKQRALELIDRVGLTSHANHKASKLSGGQKQRAVIARALAKDCPIIVADEPTGNLDRASSDQVMKLLKEIANDKLVIVVTHNFEEVAPYATRKIRLFDGEVIEDTTVNPMPTKSLEHTIINHKMSVISLAAIALKNLIRTPRRTWFSTTVLMFVVAVFLFGYGAFLQSTTSSNNTYNEYFDNITNSRIIVTKFDETTFTDTELDKIKDISKVRCVVEDDVILDSVMYTYMTNEYYEDSVDSREFYVNSDCALETVELKSGRTPENATEVVTESTLDFEIGDKIYIGTTADGYRYSKPEDVPGSTMFTVVGIAKTTELYSYRSRVYFDNTYFSSEAVYQNAYVGSLYGDKVLNISLLENGMSLLNEWSYFTYEVDDTLDDDTVQFSTGMVWQVFDNKDIIDYGSGVDPLEQVQAFLDANPTYFSDMDTVLTVESSFTSDSFPVTINGFEELDGDVNEENMHVYLNQKTYEKLFFKEDKYQIAVMVKNSFDAEIVIEDLEADGYRTIYPPNIQQRETEIFSVFTYIWYTILFGFFLTVIYFVSYVVLRNIQISKKKDYLVFRSIGANKSDLNKLTIFELVFSAIIAFAIMFTLFYLNEGYKSFIPKYYSYYTLGNFAFIFGLLVFLAVLLGNRFNKRIFNRSVITALKQE